MVFANQKQEDQRTKYLHVINDTTKEYSFSDDTFTVTFADDSTGEETKQSISFDFKSYWKHLGSCRLGRLLIYADVITSTQEVLSRYLNLDYFEHCGFMTYLLLSFTCHILILMVVVMK